jgi:hypothetical protein
VTTDEVMVDASTAPAQPTTPPRGADSGEPVAAPADPAPGNALEANIKAKGENAYYFAHAKKADASVLDVAVSVNCEGWPRVPRARVEQLRPAPVNGDFEPADRVVPFSVPLPSRRHARAAPAGVQGACARGQA